LILDEKGNPIEAEEALPLVDRLNQSLKDFDTSNSVCVCCSSSCSAAFGGGGGGSAGAGAAATAD